MHTLGHLFVLAMLALSVWAIVDIARSLIEYYRNRRMTIRRRFETR